MPGFSVDQIRKEDAREIMDIFNYYVEKSFAAYPEQRLPVQFFSMVRERSPDYPSVVVKDGNGAIAGFALLHAHNPFPTFSHTAEFTCFVRVGMTGQGLGSRMLHILEEEAKKQGISCILASISSLNEDSVRFHARHGFTECGRFRGVVKKRGTTFDTVWMQKFL
jgi:phosphinothricin acetyltransferase